MGGKHPGAGLVNPLAATTDHLKSLRKSTSQRGSAEDAGLTKATQAATRTLPKVLGNQHSQFHKGGKQVLISASLGATCDRFAGKNSTRQAARAALERFRLSDTPLTTAAVDDMMNGTECEVACTTGIMNADGQATDSMQRLSIALAAAAPADVDPCDFVREQCGCSATSKNGRHTNLVSLCGGKTRRNVGQLATALANFHELVKELQGTAEATRAAVDDHTDEEQHKAKVAKEEANLSKLSALSQRPARQLTMSRTSAALPCRPRKSHSWLAHFHKGASPAATVGQPRAAAPPRHDSCGVALNSCDPEVERQVDLLVAALETMHRSGNGNPTPVRMDHRRFGPKDHHKAGPPPGTHPPGLDAPPTA